MKEELGFYSVNGKHFTNKIAAIAEAQLTNADIEWSFYDDLFSKVNWLNEPLPSLDELYKARALQIREQYDYIIVRCSGGADSTNVLYSFLNNGIHVDEILAEAPVSGLNNWDFNTKDTRALNCASEFKYAQIPLLHEVSTNYPQVKITLLDSFEDMITMKEDFVYECRDIINPFTRVQSKMERLFHIKDMAENGKRVAVISGTDKPVLSLMPDGSVCNIFSDQPVNVPKPPFENEYPNVDRLLFYWTHEMPEIVVKMAHVVAREIHKPENYKIYQAMLDLPKRYYATHDDSVRGKLLDYMLNKNKKGYDKNESNTYQPFSIYERGIVPFIYPSTWKRELFQADKIDPSESFFSNNHEWVRILHGDMRAVQVMESDFTHFYKKISAKYLNPKKTSFKNYMKFYKIGNAAHFKKG